MTREVFEQSDPFSLSGSVGRNGENDRADVIKAQLLLAKANALDLPEPGVPTGWAGEGLHRAIGRFQRDNGLESDGLLLPMRAGAIGENGEGETLYSLQDLLGGRMQDQIVPTPHQVDGFFEAYARNPDAQPNFRTADKRDTDPPPGPPELTIKRGKSSGPEFSLLTTSDAEHDPAAPPVAGQQEAMLPLAVAPFLLAPLALGAGIYGSQQYMKSRRDEFRAPSDLPATPPSRPLNPQDETATQTPPLHPPPADDGLKGRPASDAGSGGEQLIPPDLSKWIGSLPPAQQPLAQDLTGIIVELNPHGSRGKPETELANRIAARVCIDELAAYPDLAGKLEHFAGASKLHENGQMTNVPEEVVRPDGSRTFSRPDVSFGDREDRKSPITARMNTVDVKKTGDEHDESSLTANEARRYDKLKANIYDGVAGWARKMKSGESEADYERYVARRCRAMWDDLDAKLRRNGLLPAR